VKEEVMRKKKYLENRIFVLLAVFAFNTLTYANTIYDFHIFNNPEYENDPRLNFTLTLTDEGLWHGKQKVGFTFSNNSTISSSITDIYFDARPDTGSSLVFYDALIFEGPDVSFSKYASPRTLPGGNMLTPAFDRYPEYSADSDLPVSLNGINPNEWLKLTFTLKYNRTIDDIIAEIANGGSCTKNSLRIGIYIQSLPDVCPEYHDHCHYSFSCCPPDCSNSASAINCTQPIQPIPEPATIAMLGLGTLALLRKRTA
jgi:hypothetical protein